MKRNGRVAATLVILGAAVAFLAHYSFSAITAVAPVYELGGDLPTIVIDAGHGNFDGGAIGVDNIVEKDINLAIARNLYDLFTVNGFDAVLTRQGDESLHSSEFDSASTRKKKNSDIHNRMEIAKSYPNSILLSIHQNKFPREKYWGAQVFYGPKNESSKALGEIMQRRLIEMVQPENTRVYKACDDNVYLIYNAPMPSLLIECGFLSYPEEAHKLIDPAYQKQLAFAIFSGTAEYLGLETSQPDELTAPSEAGEAENIP